jgi:hypothetical protein
MMVTLLILVQSFKVPCLRDAVRQGILMGQQKSEILCFAFFILTNNNPMIRINKVNVLSFTITMNK